ncbi:uracil-DNA glycosylase [Halomicrococcus sp. SG-WS-1]|uniref:uracil-DNA glycosylase n=1 Tax=Halomicrococcus sp. SG-WS-1 TaxID=3439057 RepID=UPI003F797E58
MPQFPDPDSRNVLEPDCSRCPELVECRNRIAWGNGSLDADVMVVGEAPAFGDGPRSTDTASGDQPRAGDADADRWRGGNWTGMAYTSRHSGRRVRELFEAAGYGPDDLYVTNAVKCFPEGEDGSNREPRSEERANCFEHLRTEIAQVEPSVVATTGKHATTALLEFESIPMDGFLARVLDPVDCERLGVTALPLLHPSYENVWRARLGYDREEYVAAVATQLEAHG